MKTKKSTKFVEPCMKCNQTANFLFCINSSIVLAKYPMKIDNFCFFSTLTDYRLSFSFNGEPKYWHKQNIQDIDFLKEHTEDKRYVSSFRLRFWIIHRTAFVLCLIDT